MKDTIFATEQKQLKANCEVLWIKIHWTSCKPLDIEAYYRPIDKHDILSPFQHCFRSKHSCETQLISFSQKVYDNLEQGKQNDITVMDFSKAFDKVDHHKHLLKLHKLGIKSETVGWIRSFLYDRTQQVAVEGQNSDNLPVLSGVPQGSVLGPCLFLSYINNLPDSAKSKVRLFSDDTIVYS